MILESSDSTSDEIDLKVSIASLVASLAFSKDSLYFDIAEVMTENAVVATASEIPIGFARKAALIEVPTPTIDALRDNIAPFNVVVVAVSATFAAVCDFVAESKPIFSSLSFASSSVRLCLFKIIILSLSSNRFWDNNNFRLCSVKFFVDSPIFSNAFSLKISSIGKFFTCCKAFPKTFICLAVDAIDAPITETPLPMFKAAMARILCFNKSVLLLRSSTAVPISTTWDTIFPFKNEVYVSVSVALNRWICASVLSKYALYSFWAEPAEWRLFCKISCASAILFSVALIADALFLPAIRSSSADASVSDISLYTLDISRKIS